MNRSRVDGLDNSDLDSIRRLAERMQLTSYSTAFTGIDSPGTAMAMLRVQATQLLGRPIFGAEHVHAVAPRLKDQSLKSRTVHKFHKSMPLQRGGCVSRCILYRRSTVRRCRSCRSSLLQEYAKHAQVEIRQHPHPPTCLFGDIADFLRPGLHGKLEELQRKDQLETILQPLVEQEKAVVAHRAKEIS